MEQHKGGFRSIDEYIATFPEDIQALLHAVQATIKASAPEAEERISYQMPTFVLNGNLVHFAVLKGHIGFYPTSSGIEAFNAIPAAIHTGGMDAAASRGHAGQRAKERHQQPRRRVLAQE
jgi:uncharacterized protein YdhG (YjbR/CyaY superfamily)